MRLVEALMNGLLKRCFSNLAQFLQPSVYPLFPVAAPHLRFFFLSFDMVVVLDPFKVTFGSFTYLWLLPLRYQTLNLLIRSISKVVIALQFSESLFYFQLSLADVIINYLLFMICANYVNFVNVSFFLRVNFRVLLVEVVQKFLDLLLTRGQKKLLGAILGQEVIDTILHEIGNV